MHKFYVSFQDFDRWGLRSKIQYYETMDEAREAAQAFCDHVGTRAIVMEQGAGICGGDLCRGAYHK